MVFLSSNKSTDSQGRVEVAWPGYGFVRKDKEGGWMWKKSRLATQLTCLCSGSL